MGILRKLAELVVEFPEEQQPAADSKGQSVLDSIEQIRADLETDLAKERPDFSSDSQELQGDSAQAGGSLPSGAQSSIRLPGILGVNDVYAKAELASTPESFDVYHVERMLQDAEIADLPLDTRAKSVRMALRSMGRELTDLLTDAARRDQALEAYEQFLGEAVADISRQVTEANAALQQQIDEFVRAKTAEIEANRATQERANVGLAEFRRAKIEEEQRLFDVIAPFVAPGQNPVQLSSGVKDGGKPGR
jgi:hypothetical protein